MQKNRKLQIEYILPAIIFVSMIWEIFAGFRVVRYQWILIILGGLLFLGISYLCDSHKKSIYGIILLFILLCTAFHEQLINGFRIINNKMALALNQSMDLGFYYYVGVEMEHSRRDSTIAVVCFLLAAGILFAFLRYRPMILFALTGIMECAVLIIAPYSVSAGFFLFLGSWLTYFIYRKGKRQFAIILYGICLLSIFPLYYHDQTNVPADTMPKRSILIQIRKMTQGQSYLAAGGLGNGDIGSIGEVSPTGENLFEVYAPEKDDLYLKSYVSGNYKNGRWINDAQDTLVYGGETALELPYLFADLHMDDFVKYKKGYIKTQKDLLFSEKRTLTIQYQKNQGDFLLFPYFCDISQIEGAVSGDSMIRKSTGKKEYDVPYYQTMDLKNILQAATNLDFSQIYKEQEGSIEQDYVKTMDEYDAYVNKTYLDVPENIKKCLETLSYKSDAQKSFLENVQEIQNYLKEHYEYTYRPGLIPQGKDPVIYFLKDKKKGFCSQYASAAVFMLRSAKIPARYVEGYKIREDQWRIGKAQVTDYEAHAWVEIYLDHIGWIPVEVTGRNTGKTAYENVEKQEKQNNAIVPNRKQFVTNVKKVIYLIPIITAIFVIILLTKMLQKKRKWKRMTNKEKVLYYENELKKYSKKSEKPRKTADRMTYEIIEKAKFSEQEITDQELVIVKRHVELLMRKDRNVTKILNRVK